MPGPRHIRPGMLLINEALLRGVAILSPARRPSFQPGVSAFRPPVWFWIPLPGDARRRFFVEYGTVAMTLSLYESPKRLQTRHGHHESWRPAVAVARNHQIHEEVFRGTVSRPLAFEGEVRGALSLVVDGFATEAATVRVRRLALELEERIERVFPRKKPRWRSP